MKINAISNVSFNGIKKPNKNKNVQYSLEKNGVFEKGPHGQWGIWTRDDGAYAFFTPMSQMTVLESDKDGNIGVYTRNGDECFFTPINKLDRKKVRIGDIQAGRVQLNMPVIKHRESEREYEKRKKESTEWSM